MRNALALQLSDADDGLHSYALIGAQRALGVQTQRAPLDTILSQAAGRQLILFVPGTDVRLSSVKVPARQQQKALQAAPYALEEQLAEDVETLHFALGPRDAEGAYPVAIVARARMDAWLARFQVKGARPDVIIPETLCVPWSGVGHWVGLADGGRVTVRTGPYSGFACPLADLDTCLQLADPDAKVPLRLHVSRETDFDFTKLDRKVELMPGHANALEVLTRHYQPESSINLLQGSYSARQDWQRTWQPWITAARLAVVWIVLALVALGADALRLSRELARQEQRNLERFQALFPDQRPTADLAGQLAGLVTASRAGGGRAPLFALLGVAGDALGANPGLTVQSLQFREGALFLNLTGSDLQALENLRAWFGSRRDAVLEVQSANATSTGVQIRLRVALA